MKRTLSLPQWRRHVEIYRLEWRKAECFSSNVVRLELQPAKLIYQLFREEEIFCPICRLQSAAPDVYIAGNIIWSKITGVPCLTNPIDAASL